MTEQQAMRKVAEAASDYLLALTSEEFAELNGGADALLEKLMRAHIAWGEVLGEEDCRSIPGG